MNLLLPSLLISICSLWGCTSLSEIRYQHDFGPKEIDVNVYNPSQEIGANDDTPPVKCGGNGVVAKDDAHSMERLKDAGNTWAAYVEFDDEGWLYEPRKGDRNQLKAFEAQLRGELNNKDYFNQDFLIVAFVHGWHHNAHPNDCNVQEFRAMLKLANKKYAAAAASNGPDHLDHERRIVGVYVGWRGESVNLKGANYTTVLDRDNAADRVARGDVRELFATLRKIQIEQSKKSFDGQPPRADRMRTVVIGHSFGGLIAFHGLSPAILNELTLTKPGSSGAGCDAALAWDRDHSAKQSGPVAIGGGDIAKSQSSASIIAPVFPDMLVLINPAFEATRFETLHELMRPTPGCSYDDDSMVQRPKVIVVTADNDHWTHEAFTAGRSVLTALEAYPRSGDNGKSSKEQDANTHAIGFTDRYITHRLCLQGEGEQQHVVASLTPPAAPDWTPLERFAPVWVVRAPPDIVDGHSGFLFADPKPGANGKQEPYLLDWLVSIHTSKHLKDSPALVVETNQCPAAPLKVQAGPTG